MDENCYKLSKF